MPYFSSSEVASHNVSADCWVSFFGKVYDLTKLVHEHTGLLVQPILRFAGQDISHWFDAKTREPKTHIDPVSGVRIPYCPYGRYVHIPPTEPRADWSTNYVTPWWRDESYCIGLLSRRKRKIRVINTLSGQEHLLEVCSEETLDEILTRYLRVNAHASSYTWKRLGRVLNMQRTLAENGIPDESDELSALLIDPDEYIPALHVYFNDDLTVA